MTEMLVATDLADTGASESTPTSSAPVVVPGVPPSEDAWVVTDPNRAIVAYTERHTRWRWQDQVVGVVHHDHRGRGLGAALLDRMEARASERLRGSPAVLHTAVNRRTPQRPRWCDRAGSRTCGAGTSRSISSARARSGRAPGRDRDPRIEPERDLRRIPRSSWRRSARVGLPPDHLRGVGRERGRAQLRPQLWLLATAGDEAVGALRASCGATGAGWASSAFSRRGAAAGSRRPCCDGRSPRSRPAGCHG